MIQEENPIPAFRIYGSQTKFLHWSYRRYLERELRESYDYVGTPVQLWFIDRDEGKIKEKPEEKKGQRNNTEYRTYKINHPGLDQRYPAFIIHFVTSQFTIRLTGLFHPSAKVKKNGEKGDGNNGKAKKFQRNGA